MFGACLLQGLDDHFCDCFCHSEFSLKRMVVKSDHLDDVACAASRMFAGARLAAMRCGALRCASRPGR
jgi:hypothetical protein